MRRLEPRDRSTDESGRNVALTPSGLAAVEAHLGCDLYADNGGAMMAAVQEALHAHTLLHRDVDYVVQDGQVLSVDEFKGRIVRDRRWPGGLQTALEWKEGVPREGPGPRPRIDHGGEPGGPLPHRLRHERHGRDAGPRLPRDVRSRGRRRSRRTGR